MAVSAQTRPPPAPNDRPSFGVRLFALPEYARAEHALIAVAIREVAMARGPILQAVRREAVEAVGTTRNTLDTGEIIDNPALTTISEFAEPIIGAATGDTDPLYAAIDRTAEQLAGEMERWIISQLDRVLTAAGQVTDAKGHFTFETLLQTYESMQLSFK